MKKFLVLLIALAILLLPALALADGGTLPTEPFSWEYLATIAGATLATMLIVQLLKLPLDKVWRIPTRIVVYVIALSIMLLSTHFTIGLTWSNAGLAAVNAVIVALAAIGGYEISLKRLEEYRANAESNG